MAGAPVAVYLFCHLPHEDYFHVHSFNKVIAQGADLSRWWWPWPPMPAQSLALFSVDRQPQATRTPAKWIGFPGGRRAAMQAEPPADQQPGGRKFSQENTHRGRIPPPTLIRGCVNIATQPVLSLEGAEIHLPLPGAISLFWDFLVCEKIAGQSVLLYEGAEIHLPL